MTTSKTKVKATVKNKAKPISKPIDISEVAKRSGLPASTIRFYEEKGLIHSIGRHGLRRLFNSNVVEHLALILLGQRAGFTLEEIAAMFTTGEPKIDKTLLLTKANELDKNIQQLTAMRDGLRHAAKCPAPSHLDCPSFQRLLRVAGKDQIKRRQKSVGKLAKK